MKHKITTLFILTFIMFIAFNCGTSGSARGDYSECEPDWVNERPESGTDDYYGVGVGESKSRRGVKNLAIAEAGREVNTQLKNNIIAELETNLKDVLVDVDGEDIRDFQERLIDNLVAFTDQPCNDCVVFKFADCEENNIWTAYALVKFDVKKWRKLKFREIAEEEFEKSSAALQAQSDKFRKIFSIG